MSATCQDYAVAAAESMETFKELGFDDGNVRREAKDDIKRVVRRLKKSAKRKCGSLVECSNRSADHVSLSLSLSWLVLCP